MSMTAGNADLGTGMAKAIFDQLKTLPGAQFSGLNSPMAQFANALAAAIVAYITANAVVPGTGLIAPVGGGAVTGAALIT